MISPEILSVMMPKALIYVPSKPVAPVEVEVQTTSSRAASQSTVVVARPVARAFVAPKSYNNPVNNIIDGADFAPPPFAIGTGSVSASTSAFVGGPVGVGVGGVPTAPPPKPEPKKEPAKPLRVGGAVQAANIVHRVNPPYPALAKQARISGVVKLEGVIAKDGTIQRLRLVSGHPLLANAALEAVKQWRYRPTLLNGEAVEVIAPIDVNFILSN